MRQNNPYASATGTYDQHAQDHTGDPRELEARVLLKSVRKMQALQNNWENVKAAEIDDVLRYNRNIWMMFVDNATAKDNVGHTLEVRTNIANLGNFIFKHSLKVLSKPSPEQLNILIKINREIAAGLMTRPETAMPVSGATTEPTASIMIEG